MNEIELSKETGIEKGVHPLDKYRDHLLHKKKLSQRDQEHFVKLMKAWSWSCKMFSPNQIVQMLHTEYGHEKTFAYKIISDAMELFGSAYELNKNGIRKTLIEAAHVALSIAIKDRNSEQILKATKELRELYRLEKEETNVPNEVAMRSGIRIYVVNGNIETPNQPNEVEDGSGEVVE
ncbi:MAG: hypothetical protein U0X91_20695 [Spirosomataceae bacterium]